MFQEEEVTKSTGESIIYCCDGYSISVRGKVYVSGLVLVSGFGVPKISFSLDQTLNVARTGRGFTHRAKVPASGTKLREGINGVILGTVF